MRWPRGLNEWAAVAGILGFILALVVVLGGVAGSPFSKGPSIEEFIADADSVCRRASEETAKHLLTGSEEEIQRSVTERKRINANALTQLSGLKTPDQLRVDFNQYVAYLQRSFELRASMLDLVPTGDTAGIDAARKAWEHAVRRSNQAARDLGLTYCGRGT
jgi:hypothetical protein